MSQAPATAREDLDLASVFAAVFRRLPRLLVYALVVGGLTAAVTSTMGPRYRSEAQLEIKGSVAADSQGRPDREAVGTHVRALMSTDLALEMARELGLRDRPDFNSALEPPDLYSRVLRQIGLAGSKPGQTDEDRLLQAYYQNVRAYQVRETRSVIVDCTTSDAKFSAECANTLTQLYRASLRGRAVVANDDLRVTLKPQVERLSSELAELEASALQFRGEANLFQAGAQPTQLRDQQLGELTAELSRATSQRSEIEARAAAAREMLRRGAADANADVQRSTLLPRLEEARIRIEGQISELGATLLPAHPRMRQLSSELTGIRRQIQDEIQRVVLSLANDARIAADRETALRKNIDALKSTVVASVGDNVRLAQIENSVRAKRAELERVRQKYEAAASTAQAGSVQPEVEIVSRAFVSNEKIFPKVGMMSGLAAFATFILGLAFTAMREIALGGRRGGGGAMSRSTSGMSFKGSDPDLMPARASAGGAAMAGGAVDRGREPAIASRVEPVSAAVDGPRPYDNISPSAIEVAAKLIAHAPVDKAFRSLVAGANPLVNPANDAQELARALAASGRKTLLVAWNLVLPAVNLPPAGVAELLCGESTLAEAVTTLLGSSADVIGSARLTGLEVDGESACVLLDALDELYEQVVVAAPIDAAQRLFAAVEGRFDAGVVVHEKQPPARNGEFIGFEVPDFQIIPLVRGQRLSRRSGSIPASTLATRPFGAGSI